MERAEELERAVSIVIFTFSTTNPDSLIYTQNNLCRHCGQKLIPEVGCKHRDDCVSQPVLMATEGIIEGAVLSDEQEEQILAAAAKVLADPKFRKPYGHILPGGISILDYHLRNLKFY